MPTPSGPHPANQLLQTLPAGQRKQLQDAGDVVELEFAHILCEAGQPVEHVYFPLSGFISLIAALDVDEDARVEVGMVGREGMFGMDRVLSVERSGVEAVVQGAGQALRIPAGVFEKYLDDSPELRRHMHRYAAVQIAQLTRTAVCNSFHCIEPRLARWLLMCLDRANDDSIFLTQRFLAYMLGVRRVGITEAAGALQEKQLINYARGKITVTRAARSPCVTAQAWKRWRAVAIRWSGIPTCDCSAETHAVQRLTCVGIERIAA